MALFGGFLLSMGGICLISFNGSQMALDLRGDLLAVIAAMVWAVYSLLTKRSFGWNVILTTRRISSTAFLFMIPAFRFPCLPVGAGAAGQRELRRHAPLPGAGGLWPCALSPGTMPSRRWGR